MSAVRHFLDLNVIPRRQLREIIDNARLMKKKRNKAVRRLLDDLATAQGTLTARLLASDQPGEAVLEAWAAEHKDGLARMGDFLAAIESAGELSVAKLMLAASQIQNLD